jgi:TonB family protein
LNSLRALAIVARGANSRIRQGQSSAESASGVEKDGFLLSARILKSSGTPSLDEAALRALSKSRFLALPPDYAPPRATMQMSFRYNDAPR